MNAHLIHSNTKIFTMSVTDNSIDIKYSIFMSQKIHKYLFNCISEDCMSIYLCFIAGAGGTTLIFH